MPLVSSTEYLRALANWTAVNGHLLEIKLLAFIQGDDDQHFTFAPSMDGFIASEEAARRIGLLTGPHYRAVIKVYQILKASTEGT